MKESVTRRTKVRFGLRVIEEREACGMTQEELAERIGLSRRQTNRIEAGKANTSITTIAALADALGVEPAALFLAPTRGTARRVGRPPKKDQVV